MKNKLQIKFMLILALMIGIGKQMKAQTGINNILAPKVLPGKGLKQFDFFMRVKPNPEICILCVVVK
ncbi:hypothetical protein [Pedobacter panaciterrae]